MFVHFMFGTCCNECQPGGLNVGECNPFWAVHQVGRNHNIMLMLASQESAFQSGHDEALQQDILEPRRPGRPHMRGGVLIAQTLTLTRLWKGCA